MKRNGFGELQCQSFTDLVEAMSDHDAADLYAEIFDGTNGEDGEDWTGWHAEIRENSSGETKFYVLAYRKSREDLEQDLRQVGITNIDFLA